MKMEWATLRGFKVRYAVVPATKPRRKLPLLICGGIGQSIESDAAFAKAMTDREVILFDAPGAGESQMPRIPLSMAEYARIVIALLDEIGEEQVDVMGISWGGALAQQLGRAYPERCRKLVLAITAAGGLTLVMGNWGLLFEMAVPTRYFSRRRRNKMVPRLAGGDALADPANVTDVYEEHMKPSLYGYYLQGLSIRFWSSLHFLHRLKQPTLVISGAKDPLLHPINQRVLACGIPDSRLLSYDCGHYLHVTRRDQVVKDVKQFLDHGLQAA